VLVAHLPVMYITGVIKSQKKVHCQIPDLRPETRKAETRKPEIQNPEPKTQDPKPKPFDTKIRKKQNKVKEMSKHK